MIERIQDFEEIIYVDFEYYCPDGEIPIPTCMSARELHSGRHFLMWADELRSLDEGCDAQACLDALHRARLGTLSTPADTLLASTKPPGG